MGPDSAWAYDAQGASPPRPRGLSKPLLLLVETVALLVAAAAAFWAVAVALDLSDYIASSCSITACPDRAIPDAVAAYGQALFGFCGAFGAARTSWRGAQLARGRGFLGSFQRGLALTLALLLAWSLLATGAIAG